MDEMMKPIDAFSSLQASIPRLWHGTMNAAITREDDAWWIACGDGQPYFAIAADAAGLDVRIEDGGCVATDGHKLVHVPVPVEGLDEPFMFSRWALALIMRPAVLREWRDEKPAMINVDGRRYFRASGVICGPVDIEGYYPDWRRVVPERKILPYRATFRTRELLEAIASLGLGKRHALGVRIHDCGGATLAGNGAQIDVPCTVSMPDRRESATFTIGLSAHYVKQLARVLDPMSKGTLTLLMQSAEGALRVEGGKSHALAVLMPMRIGMRTMFGEKEAA